MNYSREFIKDMSGKNIPIRLPLNPILENPLGNFNEYALEWVQAWPKRTGKVVSKVEASVQKTRPQSQDHSQSQQFT